jgi:hypothetical protein
MNDIIVTIIKTYIMSPNLYSQLNLIFNDKIYDLIMSDNHELDKCLSRIQELNILNNNFNELLKKIKDFTDQKPNIKLKTHSKLINEFIFNSDFSNDSKFLLFYW